MGVDGNVRVCAQHASLYSSMPPTALCLAFRVPVVVEQEDDPDKFTPAPHKFFYRRLLDCKTNEVSFVGAAPKARAKAAPKSRAPAKPKGQKKKPATQAAEPAATEAAPASEAGGAVDMEVDGGSEVAAAVGEASPLRGHGRYRPVKPQRLHGVIPRPTRRWAGSKCWSRPWRCR